MNKQERKPTKKAAKISAFYEDGKAKKKGTLLLEIAEQHYLFKGDDNQPYAAYRVDGHNETWPLQSQAYRSRLSENLYRITGQGVSRAVVLDAIDTLTSRALFDGDQRNVFKRIARLDNDIILDLCDSKWRAIRISSSKWVIEDNSTVHFLRNTNSMPYPEPKQQGNISNLWKFLNVRKEDRPLILGFILTCLNPSGPYFSLVLTGEQGTGKSTFAKVIRRICDPSTAPLRPPPKDENDFMVGAVNNWLLVLDNLSGIKPWLSDALCRVLTGGAMAGRTLYTNDVEFVSQVSRPVILNGIDNITNRPDLAERSIILDLVPITSDARMDERSFWKQFDEKLPGIFAEILQGLSMALNNIDNIDIPYKPRMADAVLWATAGETAFGFEQGVFLEAYERNQGRSVVAGLESSPLATAIIALMKNRDNWKGKPAQLMTELEVYVDNETIKSNAWPKSLNWTTGYLNRQGSSLRKIGIDIRTSRTSKGCFVEITNMQTETDEPEKLHHLRNPDTANDTNSQMTQFSELVGEEWEGV